MQHNTASALSPNHGLIILPCHRVTLNIRNHPQYPWGSSRPYCWDGVSETHMILPSRAPVLRLQRRPASASVTRLLRAQTCLVNQGHARNSRHRHPWSTQVPDLSLSSAPLNERGHLRWSSSLVKASHVRALASLLRMPTNLREGSSIRASRIVVHRCRKYGDAGQISRLELPKPLFHTLCLSNAFCLFHHARRDHTSKVQILFHSPTTWIRATFTTAHDIRRLGLS